MTPGKWRKSTRSQGGGNCVETRTFNHASAQVEVRDSKTPRLGSLAIDRAEFAALLDSVKLPILCVVTTCSGLGAGRFLCHTGDDLAALLRVIR